MEKLKKPDTSKPISLSQSQREQNVDEKSETLEEKRKNALRLLYEKGINIICGDPERFWKLPIFWCGFLILLYSLRLLGITEIPLLKGAIASDEAGKIIDHVAWGIISLAAWTAGAFLFVKFQHGRTSGKAGK